MASDEESTQPIDIESLRAALPKKQAAEEPLPSFADPDSEPEPDAVPETDPSAAGSEGEAERTAIGRSPFVPLDIHPEDTHHGGSSSQPAVTVPYPVNVRSQTITQAESTVRSQTITQSTPSGPQSLQATLQAHELAQALVAVMGGPRRELAVRPPTPSSLDRTDEQPRFGSTAEHDLVDDDDLGGDTADDVAALTAGDRMAAAQAEDDIEALDPSDAIDASDEDDDLEEHDTATRMPFPPMEPVTQPGTSSSMLLEEHTNVTSVSPGREISIIDLPPPSALPPPSVLPLPSPPSSRLGPPSSRFAPPSVKISHPADDPDRTQMGRMDDAGVRAVFAAAEASEATSIQRSPLEVTAVRSSPVDAMNLEIPPANLEVIAPVAPPSSPMISDPFGPDPLMPSPMSAAVPSSQQPSLRIEPAPQSEPSIVEVDDADLESIDDDDPDLEALAVTGESGRGMESGVTNVLPEVHGPAPVIHETREDTEDPLGDSGVGLPRPPILRQSSPFATTLASSDEVQAMAVDANDDDVELVSGASDVADPFARLPDLYGGDSEEDDGGATNFLRRDDPVEPGYDATIAHVKAAPAQASQAHKAQRGSQADEPDRTVAAPAKRSLAPPPNIPAFQPPAPAGKQVVPAYEVDTDADEDQLQREGGYRALLDLYRLRLSDADTPTARATVLHKIASVHEYQLGEPELAYDALVQAFDLRPADEDLVMSLDRVAKGLGRLHDIAERTRKNLHTADHELKVILLGHLVYWYERHLGRGAEISPFVSELERLDKTHPVALRRQAQVAAANADLKSQRDLLVRALDRTYRRDEKVSLLIALAGTYAGTPEAVKHYEAALAIDSGAIVALQGYERIGREQGKHAQVEWTLERQIEVAPTTAERVDALLKLADLYETKYLKRERAAEILEEVVEIEPSQPQALKALERCYHALRDWPRLVKVLRARADNTYDKKQKVELLELAAEVFESKIGDASAAIEVHRDLLIVDPKHRRALGDLARLYEKLGDWGNMATYKARVAELAPTKRQASQQLVQLGDFLASPSGDPSQEPGPREPIAARLQYERAVVVDPTNAAAWEALQRMAAEAGDDRRVAACLEQRGRYVDGPRQRAGIYVELANLHRRNGDERAAREAFESAVRSDATNEAAAAAMLDVYITEEKWAEAAPLCDLLVNAATRDKDDELLFRRFRLSTRVSAALGEAERAMTSALAALELRPDDTDAQADLVDVCVQCRGNAALVGRAKDRLTRISAGPTPLPTQVMVGLAVLQKDAGEIDAAAHTLERAQARDAESPEIIRELAEVYLAQGDFPRACKLKVDMARNATSAETRFQLLVDAGEIWAKRAEELDKAATVFEEARLIKPLDHWLLHTLMWLYGERHRWDDLSNVLESIAQIQESPERKAKSFFAMAQLVLEKMQDSVRAAELFDQVLDVDRKRLDAFELQVRALTEAKDWEALERAYRKMLARIQGDDDANLKFVLFQQLGIIYRDRLEDAARAYEALDAAAQLRPDNADVRRIITEILVVTDNLDNAVMRIRDLIDENPHDADLYTELYELFLRQHYFDKAWCAVNVLAQLRELTAEQQRFHEDYGPMPLSEIPGQIVEQAWRSHVLHADLDPTLTNLFALMTPAVARMRYSQLRPDQLVYAAGRPFTPAHSRMYEAIRATVANAAEILHLPPPDLLLGDPGSPVPFAPALAPYGAVHVAVPAVEARADSLVYVAGKRVAEQRPELVARAFFPAVSDLTALLAAAVRVSRQEGAKDAAGRALDASFSAVLTHEEREGIRAIVMQAAMEGGLVDVKRWSQAADTSSMRAGLLLCGDVAQARRVILAEPQSTSDLPPRERIGEVYKFATSDLYGDLRGAIGVAVQE
ncbi:MAG: hypothetical protein JST00_03250 [Deltaproteobacteria bacterium]|nr:hypothetical protein [Deltaproteobacteria bacterium]